jgi:hypothetical protein
MAIDINAIRKRMEAISGGGNKNNNKFKRWTYEAPGTYRLRVLPFKNTDPGMPFPERIVYFGISADGKGMIVSPENAGQQDPIKNLRISLFNDAKNAATPAEADELQEMAKKLKSKTVNCVAVIDRAHEEEGPQMWGPNWTDVQQLLALFLTEVGDYTDVGPDGCDLELVVTPGKKIVQSGKRKGQPVLEAKINACRKNSPAAKDDAQLQAWLDTMPIVDEYYPVTSTEETARKLQEWLDAGVTNVHGDDTERGGTSKEVKQEEKVVKTETVKTIDKKTAPKPPVTKKPLLQSVEDDLDSALDDLNSNDDS